MLALTIALPFDRARGAAEAVASPFPPLALLFRQTAEPAPVAPELFAAAGFAVNWADLNDGRDVRRRPATHLKRNKAATEGRGLDGSKAVDHWIRMTLTAECLRSTSIETFVRPMFALHNEPRLAAVTLATDTDVAVGGRLTPESAEQKHAGVAAKNNDGVLKRSNYDVISGRKSSNIIESDLVQSWKQRLNITERDTWCRS